MTRCATCTAVSGAQPVDWVSGAHQRQGQSQGQGQGQPTASLVVPASRGLGFRVQGWLATHVAGVLAWRPGEGHVDGSLKPMDHTLHGIPSLQHRPVSALLLPAPCRPSPPPPLTSTLSLLLSLHSPVPIAPHPHSHTSSTPAFLPPHIPPHTSPHHPPGKLPFSKAPQDDRSLPDMHLALYNDVVVFDQATKIVYAISWVHIGQKVGTGVECAWWG